MKRLEMVIFLLICCLLLTVGTYADNIVFVTSTIQPGNLGGLAGADSICQQRATAAGLPGSYRVWLSTITVPASAHLVQSTAPYRLVDGTLIANNWADLADGTLAATINKNENNVAVTTLTSVWTGTNTSGAYAGNGDCSNWTSSGTGIFSSVGTTASVVAAWTLGSNQGCAASSRLYCFQQIANGPAIISGRVLSSTGRPITQARIIVSGGGLSTPVIYYTNRYGNYSTAPLVTSTTYTLTVDQRRFTFSPASQNVALPGPNVTGANFTANP